MRFALILSLLITGQVAIVDGPELHGKRIQADLPASQHERNTAGSNGAGLCVWTSLALAGKWQGAPEMQEILEWMRTQPGGGWPDRVAKVIEKRAPNVSIAQYQGQDPAFLIWALKTRRKVCITYGYSERYRGKISHMVNFDYVDAETIVVQDNNFPGTWEWMSFEEGMRRAKSGRGSYWAVAILDSPPPPPVLRD
jgi:hypothetical protein